MHKDIWRGWRRLPGPRTGQTEGLWGAGCPSSLSCGLKTCSQEGQVGRMHLGGQSPTSHWEIRSPIAWVSYSQPLWVTSPTLLLPPGLGRIASMQWPLYQLPNCDYRSSTSLLKAPSALCRNLPPHHPKLAPQVGKSTHGLWPSVMRHATLEAHKWPCFNSSCQPTPLPVDLTGKSGERKEHCSEPGTYIFFSLFSTASF